MRVLVVGNGAREHAMAWKLAQSPLVDALFVAPGNAGTASSATNLPVKAEDVEGLLQAACTHNIDLTVVGPETPLAAGIVDRFQSEGLDIFGPTRQAAQLETSKAFARELMKKYGIPGPDYRVVDSYQEGVAYLEAHQGPIVVKADGLAAGKGSIVCEDRHEALRALHLCMVDRAFGSAGERVVLEQYLEGQEVSVFAFVDGQYLSPPIAACDYKRLEEGDGGPNTGGMGSYTPSHFWTPELAQTIQESIMRPTVEAMRSEGMPYKGVLYAGLILTANGPKVIEFNCRLGDPEAQVILPLLSTDFVELVTACVQGRLAQSSIRWEDRACVGVVLASGGYPGEYNTGLRITGLDAMDDDVLVFHAGTRIDGQGHVITAGGRVLTVVALGDTLAQARAKVYDNVRRVYFQGEYYRRDIAEVHQKIQA